MTFTDAEQRYLSDHPLGRLATVAPDGCPQVKPVGFRYNPELGTIDIGGYTMRQTAKYQNVERNPLVALVVDDSLGGLGPEDVRFIEIRGTAEPVPDAELIRISPRRILAYRIDPERPSLQARTIPPAPEHTDVA